MTKLLFEFDRFPAEREAIGKMLIAYGEIEFALLTCMGAVLSDQTLDTCTRILFRVHGEGARIEVADAIIRPAFSKVGLSGKWSNAYGAAKKCKNIRNQYAHCHWLPLGSIMTFMDLDQDSRQPDGEIKLSLKTFNTVLIAAQQRYFEYCLDLLWFLEPEYRKQAGLPLGDDMHTVEPRPMDAPEQYISYSPSPATR